METTPGRPIEENIRYSVVIPAYNEKDYLPRLLDSIDAAKARYRGDPDTIEVIVGDNASTDGTAEIARARGCRVAHVEKRVIGAARNGAAKLARAEVLAFVDADTQMHPETFNVIEDVMVAGKTVVGATGYRYERMSVGLAFFMLMAAITLRLKKVDVGVVFCRREDYDAVGGFSEEKLFGEDMQFTQDLKHLGEKRGQVFTRSTHGRAIVSTRKMDQFGDWYLTKLILKVIAARIFLGRKPRDSLGDTFPRDYWYNVPR